METFSCAVVAARERLQAAGGHSASLYSGRALFGLQEQMANRWPVMYSMISWSSSSTHPLNAEVPWCDRGWCCRTRAGSLHPTAGASATIRVVSRVSRSKCSRTCALQGSALNQCACAGERKPGNA